MSRFTSLLCGAFLISNGSVRGLPPPEATQALAQAIVQKDNAAARRLIESGTGIEHKFLGATPLHLAAEYGRADIVQLLLTKGAAPDKLDDLGRTPLLWAAENGHPESARVLIAHGANVNQEDPSRFRGPSDDTPPDRPLDYALRNGQADLCRLLLQSGAKIRTNDYTRLQAAIQSGKPELLAMLIEQGIDPMAHSKKGTNAFPTAGRSDQVEMIKLLAAKSRKSPELSSLLNDALQSAAEEGKASVVQFLLENTMVDLNREMGSSFGGVAQVSATEKKVPGFTALSRAIEEGHDAIAAALLEKGAQVLGRTRSGAPLLSYVIAQNRIDWFQLLLKHDPPLEAADYNGRTALMTAAMQGKLEIVKTLVRKGAKVEQRDSYRGTPLLLACATGKTAVAEYLLNSGAALSDRDKDGRDPLIYAAAQGYADTCSFLLSKGADTKTSQPSSGMTALHWAAKNAHPAAVKALLEGGASSEQPDKSGRKPIDCARLSGDAESIALLAPPTQK